MFVKRPIKAEITGLDTVEMRAGRDRGSRHTFPGAVSSRWKGASSSATPAVPLCTGQRTVVPICSPNRLKFEPWHGVDCTRCTGMHISGLARRLAGLHGERNRARSYSDCPSSRIGRLAFSCTNHGNAFNDVWFHSHFSSMYC